MQTNEKIVEDLRQWLLGILSEEDSRLLEQQLMADSELYEEFLVVEDELIDEYIAGSLTAEERKAFELYFMNSPERQEQFRIANALRSYIDSKDTVKNPELSQRTAPQPVLNAPERRGLPWIFANKPMIPISLAAAVILVCGLVWLAWNFRPPPSGSSLAVFLTPGGHTREGSSAVQDVAIPPGTKLVQFHLRLGAPNGSQNYRVTLLNSEGTTVLTKENLTPETLEGQQTIRVPVDAQQIPPDVYRLKLDSVSADGKIESADSYRFVVKQ